jgi:hypothetical protein
LRLRRYWLGRSFLLLLVSLLICLLLLLLRVCWAQVSITERWCMVVCIR